MFDQWFKNLFSSAMQLGEAGDDASRFPFLFAEEDPQELQEAAPLVPPEDAVTLDEAFFASFIDNRLKAPEKNKIRTRLPGEIDAIVLHQMGVHRTDASRRFHLVRDHFVVTMGGKIHHNYDLTTYIYQANLFNRRSIGIELAGNFEGQHETGNWYKPDKFGRDVATDIQLYRTNQLMKWLVEGGPKEGVEFTHVFAHRQSGRSRRLKRPNRHVDPGSRVWGACGVWAQTELGLSDGGPGYVFGGLPITSDWDPRDRTSD